MIYCPPKEFLYLSVFNVVVLTVLCLTVIIFVWLDVTKTSKSIEHKEVEEIVNRLCLRNIYYSCVFYLPSTSLYFDTQLHLKIIPTIICFQVYPLIKRLVFLLPGSDLWESSSAILFSSLISNTISFNI